MTRADPGLQLIPIDAAGLPASAIGDLPEIAAEVAQAHVQLYEASGYLPPWIGYLACIDGRCVGSCGFKGPLNEGRVEIAYFTFPPYEARGIATRMARALLELAWDAAPTVLVTAETLPVESASTRILGKLGFVHTGSYEHAEDGLVWTWQRSPAAV